jgi:hypothetical protein
MKYNINVREIVADIAVDTEADTEATTVEAVEADIKFKHTSK